MPERRSLSFARLEDVMPDVDRLLQGHDLAGRWTLGQICHHLAVGMQKTKDGVPGRVPWIVRKIVGPLAKRHIFRTGRMPEGVKLPDPSLAPRDDHDDRAEAEALRATIRLFLQEPGPFAPHPFFGPLSIEDWRRLHCIHCAHHLSFAIPKG